MMLPAGSIWLSVTAKQEFHHVALSPYGIGSIAAVNEVKMNDGDGPCVATQRYLSLFPRRACLIYFSGQVGVSLSELFFHLSIALKPINSTEVIRAGGRSDFF